jgi:hypothetical protein
MKLLIIITINGFVIIVNFHNRFNKALTEIFQFRRALQFSTKHKAAAWPDNEAPYSLFRLVPSCKSQLFSGVKLTLYQGLYDVVIRNGALCGAVLDMLHHHVVVSNINNPNSINPIDIDEMIGEESGEPYVKVKIQQGSCT